VALVIRLFDAPQNTSLSSAEETFSGGVRCRQPRSSQRHAWSVYADAMLNAE